MPFIAVSEKGFRVGCTCDYFYKHQYEPDRANPICEHVIALALEAEKRGVLKDEYEGKIYAYSDYYRKIRAVGWEGGDKNKSARLEFLKEFNAFDEITEIEERERKLEEEKKEKEKRQVVKKFLKFLEDPKEIESKRRIVLYPNFIFQKKDCDSDDYSLLVTLEIGVLNGKKYKLASKLPIFLRGYKHNTITFGKGLEFNPTTDYFSERDKRILEIAKICDDISQNYRYSYNYGYNSMNESNYITNEGFFVPETFLDEFMKYVEEPKKEGERVYLEKLEKSPLNIKIEESSDKLTINTTELNKINFLENRAIFTMDTDELVQRYFFMEREQVVKLKKLKGLVSKVDIETPVNDNLLPKIIDEFKNISKIELGEKIKEKVFIPNEKTNKIFLDKGRNGELELILETFYDGKKIDEYSQILIDDIDGKDSAEIISSKLLENKFIKDDFLKSHKLKNGDMKFQLTDDEDIFKFMTKGIDEFHELAEIFYSEKLKEVKYVRPSIFIKSDIGKNNLLELNFSIEGVPREEINKYIEGVKEKKKYLKLKNGSIIKLENTKELEELESIFSILNPNAEELKNGVLRRGQHYSYFIQERLKNFKNVLVSESVNELSEKICEVEKVEIPEMFNMLREYQKVGVQWLYHLRKFKLGGILADDMGLGKTLQTIVYLSITQEESQFPSIIITPKSLVYNWKNEIEKFAPHLNVVILTDSKKERELRVKEITKNDILITSYGVLQKDQSLYENIRFENIILDEAQSIKNPFSKNKQGVVALNGEVRIALTGTPIENNLLELWSIFDFVLPGYLGTHTKFQEVFMKSAGMDKLKTLAHPFILRRLKRDVLKELPEKIESDVMVELSKEQKKLYVSYLAKVQKEILEEVSEIDSGQNQMKILAVLTRLRQICSHPKLFVEEYKGDSAKLELLLELLSEYKEAGHKVLLFSQFTEMLKIIEEGIKDKFDYLYLDGKISGKDRINLVNEFNLGTKDVFLISLKAGGTGLNLTGADVVIHFDPWWNPAVEDQATDRAHRIGQEKNIQVIKLISIGTIEEKISKLKEEKKQIVTELFDGNQGNLLKLSKEELLNLLK